MSAVPAISFYPNVCLPPFKRIPLIFLELWPITSGLNSYNAVVPYMIFVPYNGKLKIQVTISQSGTFYLGDVNWDQQVLMALNGGNALNVNTLYEFELYVVAGTLINFFWVSSSSSVTSAYIHLYVYLEPEGCERSGSE